MQVPGRRVKGVGVAKWGCLFRVVTNLPNMLESSPRGPLGYSLGHAEDLTRRNGVRVGCMDVPAISPTQDFPTPPGPAAGALC